MLEWCWPYIVMKISVSNYSIVFTLSNGLWMNRNIVQTHVFSSVFTTKLFLLPTQTRKQIMSPKEGTHTTALRFRKPGEMPSGCHLPTWSAVALGAWTCWSWGCTSQLSLVHVLTEAITINDPNCTPEEKNTRSAMLAAAPDAAVEGVSLPPNPLTLEASRPASEGSSQVAP